MIRAQDTDGVGVPRLDVGDWIETGFDWFVSTFEGLIDGVGDTVTFTAEGLAEVLAVPDALILTVILAVIAWLVKDWKLALGTVGLMLFIIAVDQWNAALETLALVAVATVIALIIGVPLGILAAKSQLASRIVRPLMDLMQTMPALVWLIPALAMFSLGMAAGVFATLIFALPPGARFTELAIRQVDEEVVEAGHAFGATPMQVLFRIQLPLAAKTIMAGVNQVIMLALSMAVFAGFVAAGGLGTEVVRAINQLDLALGFEAGLAVVMLAIYLDRVTAAASAGDGLIVKLLRRRKPVPEDESGQTQTETQASTQSA